MIPLAWKTNILHLNVIENPSFSERASAIQGAQHETNLAHTDFYNIFPRAVAQCGAKIRSRSFSTQKKILEIDDFNWISEGRICCSQKTYQVIFQAKVYFTFYTAVRDTLVNIKNRYTISCLRFLKTTGGHKFSEMVFFFKFSSYFVHN